MVGKAELEARIAQIQQALEQSAAQHNALLGRLEETKFFLQQIFEKEIKVKEEGARDASS